MTQVQLITQVATITTTPTLNQQKQADTRKEKGRKPTISKDMDD